MENIFHGVWVLESTGEVFEYPVFQHTQTKEWLRNKSTGYAPILYRIENGATFSHYAWQGDPAVEQYATKPPIPVPNASTGDDPADQRFGKWTAADAIRTYRRMTSEGYDIALRTDKDFAAAIDFALENKIVVPAEVKSVRDDGVQYKRFAELTVPQQNLFKNSFALLKSYSLVSSRNGLFRIGGPWAVYGGYVEAECRACAKKMKYPASGWIAEQCKCDCVASDDYARDGRKYGE